MLVTFALTIAAPAIGQTEPAPQTTDREVRFVPEVPHGDPELLRYAEATGPWRDWITLDDIPTVSWPASGGAQIHMTVTVAPDDTIAGCEARNDPIAGPDGDAGPALQKLACDLVRRRGHFHHALSLDGKPVADVVKMDVSLLTLSGAVQDGSRLARPDTGWYAVKPPPLLRVLPWHDAKPLSFRLSALPAMKQLPSVLLHISAKGEVTGCSVDGSSGSDAGDAAVCQQLRAARFTPATDWEGHPVAQRWLSLDLSQYQ